MHINFEFKARCDNPTRIRAILANKGADYKGRDHQIDIYFNVPYGRLKLRKGNIENSLIWYEREDYAGAKQSKVRLFKTEPDSALGSVLTEALGIKVIVDKHRDIYFIRNVKFHVDEVIGLGSFVEVEAIDKEVAIGREKLQEQCNLYRDLLGIKKADFLAESYSDLLLKLKKGQEDLCHSTFKKLNLEEARVFWMKKIPLHLS